MRGYYPASASAGGQRIFERVCQTFKKSWLELDCLLKWTNIILRHEQNTKNVAPDVRKAKRGERRNGLECGAVQCGARAESGLTRDERKWIVERRRVVERI